MEPAEIILREYDSLRQESIASQSSRVQIVAFGLGTVGVLVAGVLAMDRGQGSNPLLYRLIFSVSIPAVCMLILYIWLGEVHRMLRIGQYLADLERRLNSLAGFGEDGGIGWESVLRDSRSAQLRYPYIAVIALFLGFAFGGPALGLLLGGAGGLWWVALPWIITAVALWDFGGKARGLTRSRESLIHRPVPTGIPAAGDATTARTSGPE